METLCKQGNDGRKRPGTGGFSLVELLTVITIIAIVASIFSPTMGSIRNGAEVGAIVAGLRNFATAFRAYSMLEGGYPLGTHETIPSGVEVYLAAAAFEREAPISGRYNREGPEAYSYVGISLTTTMASTDDLALVDHQLDDGDLATGFFRQTPNGRYTYTLKRG